MNDKNLSTKYAICLEGILSGNINSDTTAKIYLNYKSPVAFQRFKHRFTERIKNYIFLIDAHAKRHNKSDRLHISLWKELALAKILLKSNNSENGYAVLSRTYTKSKEYEYLDLMESIISILVAYYSYISPNKAKYREMVLEQERTSKHSSKRKLVDKYYSEVSHLASFSDEGSKQDISKVSLQHYKELVSIFEEDDFAAFRVLTSQIGSYGYMTAGQPEESITASLQCLSFIEQKTNVDSVYRVLLYKDLIDGYLKAKDYALSLDYIAKVEALQLSHNHNFFRLQAAKFQILAHMQDYGQLYLLLQEITSIRILKKNKVRSEQWKIKAAFIHFLTAVGKIEPQLLKDKPLKPFRLQRFINDIQHFSKDKRGMNIAVHVIQLLFFLKDKKYDRVTERLESLTQYSYRYLRNDSTLRSNCFIKMLLKLPEADYNPIRTQRYVAKYHKRLLENPLEVSMQSGEVEVLPYEHLWDIILELLSDKSK